MTDAEKELRRLALTVTSGERDYENDMLWPLSDYHAQKTATTVLALLDRIEALEKAVIQAERKGKAKGWEGAAKIVSNLGFHNLASVFRAADPGDSP